VDLVFLGDDVADLIHRQTSARFPSISCNSERIRESCLLISFLTRSQIVFNRSLLILNLNYILNMKKNKEY